MTASMWRNAGCATWVVVMAAATVPAYAQDHWHEACEYLSQVLDGRDVGSPPVRPAADVATTTDVSDTWTVTVDGVPLPIPFSQHSEIRVRANEGKGPFQNVALVVNGPGKTRLVAIVKRKRAYDSLFDVFPDFWAYEQLSNSTSIPREDLLAHFSLDGVSKVQALRLAFDQPPFSFPCNLGGGLDAWRALFLAGIREYERPFYTDSENDVVLSIQGEGHSGLVFDGLNHDRPISRWYGFLEGEQFIVDWHFYVPIDSGWDAGRVAALFSTPPRANDGSELHQGVQSQLDRAVDIVFGSD